MNKIKDRENTIKLIYAIFLIIVGLMLLTLPLALGGLTDEDCIRNCDIEMKDCHKHPGHKTVDDALKCFQTKEYCDCKRKKLYDFSPQEEGEGKVLPDSTNDLPEWGSGSSSSSYQETNQASTSLTCFSVLFILVVGIFMGIILRNVVHVDLTDKEFGFLF